MYMDLNIKKKVNLLTKHLLVVIFYLQLCSSLYVKYSGLVCHILLENLNILYLCFNCISYGPRKWSHDAWS